MSKSLRRETGNFSQKIQPPREKKKTPLRYPGWPKPSPMYPNNCQYLFPSTTHVIRVTFSGGVSRFQRLPRTTSGVFFHRLGPILCLDRYMVSLAIFVPIFRFSIIYRFELQPVRTFHPIYTYSSFTHFTFISEHPHPQMSFQGWCNITDPRINGHILTHHISNRITGRILIKKIPTNKMLRIQRILLFQLRSFPKI